MSNATKVRSHKDKLVDKWKIIKIDKYHNEFV
jgi:hypothetical protein